MKRRLYFRKREKTIISVIVLGIFLTLFFSLVYYKGHKESREVPAKKIKSPIDYLPPPSPFDHYKWKSNTPYTMVNYFSMDCPHCRKMDELENISTTEYANAFSLIYRQSPLPDIQPLSSGKAVIAECVYEQLGDEGMFAFITNTYNKYVVSVDNKWVKNIALQSVKSPSTFESCLTSQSAKEKIIDAKKSALMYGVTGTPTIGVFKDGELVMRFDKTGENNAKRIMDLLVSFKK